MEDPVSVKGEVSIVRVTNRDGIEVPPETVLAKPSANPGELGPNLVVDGGRIALARLLGGDYTGYQITKVSFGTGDDPPRYNDVTLSPQPGGIYVGGENQVELTVGVETKALDATTFPAPYLVRFYFSLDYNEANGMVIREVGLWTADDVLFARKSFPGLIKSAENRIELAWTLRC